MAWDPDRRSNSFFSPPAHLCAVTYMTEISLIVTLNNQFTHSLTYIANIIQLLTGDEGNIWYVGPEDKMLPEAEGRGQHFVWRSNISYVARIPSQ